MSILVGSKLLKVDSIGSDTDELELTALHNQCLFAFCKHFISKDDFYASWGLFQLSNGFHAGPDYELSDFNIFDHKDTWISCLKGYINSIDHDEIASKTILPKWYYQYVYQYYMIKENQHYISEEAKAEVQKIHDLEVPGSYIYHIKDLINSL